ncbi:MAG: glycosyltransferase family 4 protein [Nocardioidaceae bacterium]
MSRTLVVTNDFPTRRGGIEAFVFALCEQLDSDEVVVYTASMPGAAEFDGELGFEVVRDRSRILLPSGRVARRAREMLRTRGCDRVLFGASAPLGLLAPRLRSAGAQHCVALTHGHETWWATVPGARSAMRRIGDSCDTLTYVSSWCRDQVARALSPDARSRLRRLTPGVDSQRFKPGCGGDEVRARLGIREDASVVVCAARMVARKGQDTLVRAWPLVLSAVPQAMLLLVGDGSYRRNIERLSVAQGVRDNVAFAGSVPWAEMPAHFDAGDVFAMPSRTRLAGLEPEALGIVFLEAAACGLPVVVGDSGGASDAVRPEETGFVVDPRDPEVVAGTLIRLLQDRELAARMGSAGRSWMGSEWTWSGSGTRLKALLAGQDPDA